MLLFRLVYLLGACLWYFCVGNSMILNDCRGANNFVCSCHIIMSFYFIPVTDYYYYYHHHHHLIFVLWLSGRTINSLIWSIEHCWMLINHDFHEVFNYHLAGWIVFWAELLLLCFLGQAIYYVLNYEMFQSYLICKIGCALWLPFWSS